MSHANAKVLKVARSFECMEERFVIDPPVVPALRQNSKVSVGSRWNRWSARMVQTYVIAPDQGQRDQGVDICRVTRNSRRCGEYLSLYVCSKVAFSSVAQRLT